MSKITETLGSQRLLLNAVNSYPNVLYNAMLESGVVSHGERIDWVSPLAADEGAEYRDNAALIKLGLMERVSVRLSDFWPARGPVWDGLARSSHGRSILLEAKAHIPEMASPGTKASDKSRVLIEQSLLEARRYYAPQASASWSSMFYQYANRLAFHYWLRERNQLESRLVFLAFVNASEVGGPSNIEEWHGATRLLHAALGLPKDLRRFDVYHAFVDAREVSGQLVG